MSKTPIMRTDLTGLRGWLMLLLAFASVHPRVTSQSPVTPPLRITYQGYLLGGDGLPLASTAARAYDVVFRIFAEETGGAALWAELQTATVEKGYFSVQLGEGVPIAGVTNPSAGLAAVFTATDATNRYVALSVRGVGANGTDLEIQPRVRLLAAPFAYLAQAAGRLVDGTGADAVVATASGLSFAKPVSALNLSAPAISVGSVTVSNAITVGGSGGTSSSGSRFVESSDGALRIISGRHRWTGTSYPGNTGSVFNAEPSPGYSISRISGGRYKVTFDTPFNAPPSVTVTTIAPNIALTGWPHAWPAVVMSPDPASGCREFILEIYYGYKWSGEFWYFYDFGKAGAGTALGIHSPLQFIFNSDYSSFNFFTHAYVDWDFQFHAVGP